MKHVIDSECVHNWRNYVGKMLYFADLSASGRAAMNAAHDRHHTIGSDAREEVYRAVNECPGDLQAAEHV